MGSSQGSANPCIGCGACCAFFRVAFSKDDIFETPAHLKVDLDSQQQCMKGTEHKHSPKCISLQGRIGKNACCTTYNTRPTPCRAFKASYEDGRHNPRCDEARRKHGLHPLRREDFFSPQKEIET